MADTDQEAQTLSLGIDIGGTKAHGLVLDGADRVLAERVLPTQPTETGIRRTVVGVAAELARDLDISEAEFTSVGLGIPGVVDHATGVVETAVNLGITRTDLADVLADAFGVAVRVENDVKATALGAGLALGRTHRDLAYPTSGPAAAAAINNSPCAVRGTLLARSVIKPSTRARRSANAITGLPGTAVGGAHARAGWASRSRSTA